MDKDSNILALKKYSEELSGILNRFNKTRDGIFIKNEDDPRYRQIVIEIFDLLEDSFGENNYSKMISAQFNDGISNFTGTPSYKSIENIHGIISAALTKMENFSTVLSDDKKFPTTKAETTLPTKITIPWLIQHVHIKMWAAAFGFVLTIFVAGIHATKFPIVQELFDLEYHVQKTTLDGYRSLKNDIFSYKKVVGPPPNVGLITSAIRGLRKFENKKDESLIILHSLEDDKYLRKSNFTNEYKKIMKETKATINFLKTIN